jgi:hypothetical protein
MRHHAAIGPSKAHGDRGWLAPLVISLVSWSACASTSDGPATPGTRSTPSAHSSAQPTTQPHTALPPGSGLPPLVARHGELALTLAAQLRNAKACGDVADVIERYVERHKAELAPTVKAVIAWEKVATPDELKAYYRNVFPAIEVRIDAGERCEKHLGARRAFERYFAATGLD